MEIEIDVVDKRAAVVGTPTIVCGNSGYSVKFNFDDEWDEHEDKKARFVYVKNGTVVHKDVDVTDDTCEAPILSNVREVRVGVYAGNLSTTTPAAIPCEQSILCESGEESITVFEQQADDTVLWRGATFASDEENAVTIY